MKVFDDNTQLADFVAWSGATETKQTILEQGKEEDFHFLIEDLYPNGLSRTALNDLLWFDEDFIFENLGIETED